jgi:hypothetical protein
VRLAASYVRNGSFPRVPMAKPSAPTWNAERGTPCYHPAPEIVIVASGLFIAALALLLATSIAISIRERPLRQVLDRVGPLFGGQINERVVFLSVLLLFDLVCAGLLARFGTSLS